jgi:hypothetical protein
MFGLTVLAATLFVAGCDTSSSGSLETVTFSNESSFIVKVSPGAGESFAPFTLEPGQSETVHRNGLVVNYTFTASGNVDGLAIGNDQVVFVNPAET